MKRLVDRILCRLGQCRSCRTHSTNEGIGGKCVLCGRLYGWMTREELAEAMRHTPS